MDIVTLLLKLAIAGLMLQTGYVMVQLVRLGRQARRTHHEMDLFEHRTMFPNLVYGSGLLVVLVLVLKGVRGSGLQTDTLASVHQFFSFSYAMFVILVGIFLTGKKNRRAHGPLAYTLAALYVGMFITGSFRLWYA